MKVELSDEAIEYGATVRRALDAAGGDELVIRAEHDPAGRDDLITPALAELGAWDLDVRSGGDEAEAAAALCRNAGWWALPYPVAERLARPAEDVRGLVVVGDGHAYGPLAGMGGRWATVTLDGTRRLGTPLPPRSPVRKAAFVIRLELEPPNADPDLDVEPATSDAALGLVLGCWTLLGLLDRAIALTGDYVRERRQFGQPLASFQGVQFQLTEAEVERAGVEELAKHALWSVTTQPAHDAMADALALRLAAVEAAEVVFRITHQLHGAIGFCDEATLSWLSRHSQPLRRLPLSLSATRNRLGRHVGRHGLSGLFDELVEA